jgi:Flp pilus assembly protein TadG
MRNPGIRNWFSDRRDWIFDRRGNVAITFALAIIPVFGAMGAAVDYSLANSARTNMQASLDATAIALSRMMPLTQQQLDTIGGQFFFGNLGNSPLANITVTILASTTDIKLDATGTFNTGLASVLKLVGAPTSFPVGAHATVAWNNGKVEVALALDNTGSMNDNDKLNQLKIASHNLIEILKNAAKSPGDAKVSIVPFGVQVKLDTSLKNSAWLRWDDASQWSWTGCVEDRSQDYDTTDADPTTSAKKFWAATGCGNLASILPLSYNWGTQNSADSATLHGKINSMTAGGNTNVTIGVEWAWHTLSPTNPFTDGAAYGTANLSKYMILLTDGENTENRWCGGGWGGGGCSSSQIDARTKLACANAKAAGIKIYAIRVIDGNEDLLKNYCATDPVTMYFNVQDASQLGPVFSAIGSTIAKLHLSK